jgi:Carboxypeptidase regulatory-like domain
LDGAPDFAEHRYRARMTRTRNRLRLGAVTAIATLTSSLLAVPAVADPVGLTGVVTVEGTSTPIAGACLTLFSTPTTEAGTFCTGADGRYLITGVPGDQNFKIRITAAGYRERWNWDAPDYLNAELTSIPQYDLVTRDFTLGVGAGVIKGQITDDKGAPIESTVTVTKVDQSWSAIAYTWDSGTVGAYSLKNIPPGDYKVSIDDGIHGHQWAHQKETFDAGDVFTVAAGAEVVVNEQWLPLGAVEFTVVDEDTGTPVEKPCVYLSTSVNPGSHCGSAGKILVTDVVPGDWAYDLTGAPTHFQLPGEHSVHVERSKTTQVSAALRRGAALTTKVVDAATGQGLGSICFYVVQVRPDGTQDRGSTYCSWSDGTVEMGPFGGSPSFQLYAWQSRNPYSPPPKLFGDQWVTANGGTGDQRLATMVTIPSKTTVSIPTVRMDPPGSITGVVKNAAGSPVSGVCTYPWAFFPGILGLPAGRCTNAQGQYTIKDLGPYKWPVKFVGYPYVYATTWSGNVADRYSATLVQVPVNGTGTMNATLAPQGTLTGTLRGPSGGWNEMWVIVYDARTGDAIYRSFAPDNYQTGTYKIPLLNTQKVYINFGAEGTGCWYGPAAAPGRKVLPAAVAVSAGTVTTLNLDTRINCAGSPFVTLPRR